MQRLGDYIKEYSARNKFDEEIPVYSVTNSNGFCRDYFGKEVASNNKRTYKIVPRNAFAYNPSRINVGSVDYQHYEDRVIVSPLYNVFTVDEKILPQYLYFYLKSPNTMKRIRTVASGSVRDNLKLSMLCEFPIQVPSINRQQNIIELLEKVQRIIDENNDELEKLDNLVKARFVEMFGNVVVNDKSWATKPISSVAPASSPKIAVSENIWLLNLDMIESQSGKVLDRLIVSKNKINASTCAFDDKNVLYSKLRPYLNKVVLPDQEGYCTTELVPLRPSNELNREFLATLLRSDAFVGYINEKTAGAKMPRVSMNIFRQFECILPPITLQEQFSVFYKQIDKSKFVLSNELTMCDFYIRLIHDRVMHSRINLRVAQ